MRAVLGKFGNAKCYRDDHKVSLWRKWEWLKEELWTSNRPWGGSVWMEKTWEISVELWRTSSCSALLLVPVGEGKIPMDTTPGNAQLPRSHHPQLSLLEGFLQKNPISVLESCSKSLFIYLFMEFHWRWGPDLLLEKLREIPSVGCGAQCRNPNVFQPMPRSWPWRRILAPPGLHPGWDQPGFSA